MYKQNLLFPEINGKIVHDNVVCTICPQARQTRSVYSNSFSKTSTPLELLHIDIWGPFRYLTRTNCSMFITIVDDYSMMTWIFLIKHKLDFAEIFRQFVSYIENQLDLQVKTISTDNAREVSEGKAMEFYIQKGIKHETSCPETPQQNRVVERKQKHLMKTAR